jgi:hypothetical protein
MFRVGAFALIALVLSMVFGCSDETTEATTTGVEIGFPGCITFMAEVFIDGNFVGSYSSERTWVIEVAAGNHTLEAHANLIVHVPDTTWCWSENFSVSDGNVTALSLPCDTAGCPGSE